MEKSKYYFKNDSGEDIYTLSTHIFISEGGVNITKNISKIEWQAGEDEEYVKFCREQYGGDKKIEPFQIVPLNFEGTPVDLLAKLFANATFVLATAEANKNGEDTIEVFKKLKTDFLHKLNDNSNL
jgi:hypothetical protein